jgi:Uma2 family endonuclease
MVQTLISVSDYLSRTYHPDMDYVDGQLEERNMGEKEHGKLQARVFILLKKTRRVFPFIETRLRVSPTRYRIPDVCVYLKEPDESVFTQPPLLCVEILSPEDRMSRIGRVIEDYIRLGVNTVWILDPLERKSYLADAALGLREVSGSLPVTGSISLTTEEIFSQEDLF